MESPEKLVQKLGKVDAELSAAKKEQNCYSELSLNSNPDSKICKNLLTYILQSTISLFQTLMDPEYV